MQETTQSTIQRITQETRKKQRKKQPNQQLKETVTSCSREPFGINENVYEWRDYRKALERGGNRRNC